MLNTLGFLFGLLLDFFLSFFNRFTRASWYLFFQKYKIAFIISLVSFMSALFLVLKNIYNLITDFFNLLNNSIANTGSEVVNVGFNVLKSVGFFDALSDATTIFLPVVFATFTLVTLKIAMNISKEKMNLFYKSSSYLSDSENSKGKNRFKAKK